jgi:hypothetical protein
MWKIAAAVLAIFLMVCSRPLADPRYSAAIVEAFRLLHWYARDQTLACVVPALAIDGKVKLVGKVPTEAEITTPLTSELAKQ